MMEHNHIFLLFYELNNDANPGNDFGDSDNTGCSWTFCFDLEGL